MKLVPTHIAGLLLVEPTVFADDRGWFMETFHEAKFHQGLQALGLPIPRPFVQDNHSSSKKGVLRGLHYQQSPHAQGKLVRVVQGAAWDVAVDIRRGSPTFGQWVGAELSADNKRQFWIPEGFAHGFIALQDDTHFLYKTTDFYNKDSERCIRWDDPTLTIDWPMVEGRPPIVNDKDANAPGLGSAASSTGP
ncbi:MAG: dTDP-4-dehydrorhamnose 3,5-epimerase [Pseudomonadota bacterium]|jgi:dTDP-4-dehydrorhamnose 3,5-epimerase